MEYCDFASVIAILMKSLNEGSVQTQSALFKSIFQTFLDSDCAREFSYDNGQLSRWFNGQVRLPDIMLDFYQQKQSEKWMIQDIQYNVFPSLSDSSLTVEKLHGLMFNDESISLRKRKKLAHGYPFDSDSKEGEFIANILLFSMTRPFVRRDNSGYDLVLRESRLPALQDYILDGGIPSPCRYFCGRAAELTELHDRMIHDRKIFMRGIAGIGKSEVAKAYAKQYRSFYKDILYLQYNGNLKDDIACMTFVDDTIANIDTRFVRHNSLLKKLSASSLIIIDNFNAAPGEDQFIETLLKYRCRILITTRCLYSDYPEYELKELKSKPLLMELFGTFYSQTERHKAIVWDIIQTVHSHTFVIELAARLLELDAISPRHLLRKLKDEKAAMDASDYIGIMKDGHRSNETYYGHIRILFGLYKISLSQKYVMRNLCVCPTSGIHSSLFSYIAKLSDLNHVTQLVDMGLVRRQSGGVISLQPIIQEASFAELQPSVKNCHKLISSLTEFCCLHNMELENFNEISQVLESVIQTIINDNDERYITLMNDSLLHMTRYHYSSGIQLVKKKLDYLMQEKRMNSDQSALYLQNEALDLTDLDEKIKHQLEAIKLAEPVTQENALLISNLYANLGVMYRVSEQFEPAMKSITYALSLYKQFDIPEKSDYITQSCLFASMLIQSHQLEKAEQLLDRLEEVLKSMDCEKTDHIIDILKLRAYLAYQRNDDTLFVQYLQQFIHLCKETYHDDLSRIIEKMII